MRVSKDGYVSEFTAFMNEYVKTHPEVLDDQRIGRAIYWDKKVNFEAQDEVGADSVPTDGYYYFGNP